MMERVRKSLRSILWRRVIAYVLVWCLVMNTSVPTLLALESGDVNSATGVDLGLVTWGDHTIIPADHGAVIDWNNFNTVGGQIVEFEQATAMSAVLNKITSGAVTLFDGALTADGRVFIVNPAGIVFGAGSSVDVTQLVASGLSITNWDPVTGPGDPIAFDGGGAGTVRTTAGSTILADSVILVGKKVKNVGAIRADDGLIVLAAGEQAYIAQDGSSVVVEVLAGSFYGDDTTPDVENRSNLRAERGQVVLAAGDTFSRAISNPGNITARQGSITAHAARIESTGNISASAGAPGGGGTIHLSGTKEVVLDPGTVPGHGATTANAAMFGPGGSITLECTNDEGTGRVTIADGHTVSARGGTVDGDGGNIKITADEFMVAGDIDASPVNPEYANGTLEIDPPTVEIVDGANLGAPDTIYTDDMETLSIGGTNLIVRADDTITVQDLVDGIVGGRGDIELDVTGPDGSLAFVDPSDTISTTRGDIRMSAGSVGIVAGNLETGGAGLAAAPGQIVLETENGGPISAQSLTIKGGQSSGVIDVTASGELTVYGAVFVGADSPIGNDVLGGAVEALVDLESGDDMILNGAVTADAYATAPGDATATVRVFAGVNEGLAGDATINEDLLARARADDGTSDALVHVNTWGEIIWGADADATAIGDSAEVLGVRETTHREDPPDEADVIIEERRDIPDLEGFPDEVETHMGDPVSGNVLDNDVDPDGGDIDVLDHTDPAYGTLTVDLETGEFTYTPDDPGYVGEDTFTYRATDEEGVITDPVTVTIDVTNELPAPLDDTVSTHMNQPVEGNVLTNDPEDPDGDPVTIVLDGTAPSHGTVELLEDGSFTYTPDEGYVGEDTFTYDVTDGQVDALGDPVVATATVTVSMGNELPAPVDDAAKTFAGRPVSGNVLTNDTDPDGDPLTVVLDGKAPANGKLDLNPDGTFTYTPDPGFVGDDTFVYEVTDGQPDTSPAAATVTITVAKRPIPPMSPVAPGLEKQELELKCSGNPALTKWASLEVGAEADMIEIYVANALASSRDMPPVETYAKLRMAAVILQDSEGSHVAALTQVVNEFASSTAPPTEEQMASIADAIASNAGADNHYGVAEEYLKALAQYIGILTTEMGFSMEDAVKLATANYVRQLAERGNANVAAYVTARLAAL